MNIAEQLKLALANLKNDSGIPFDVTVSLDSNGPLRLVQSGTIVVFEAPDKKALTNYIRGYHQAWADHNQLPVPEEDDATLEDALRAASNS